MLTVSRGSRPEAVLQGAEHVLFVEGNDANALDPTVLEELLPIRIETLVLHFQ